MRLKKLERKIENKWVLANLKYLPLLFLIWGGMTLAYAILNIFYTESSIRLHGIIRELARGGINLANILIVPLCAINLIYFLFKGKPFNASLWKRTTLKILVVFVGIVIGTAICEVIEYFFSAVFFHHVLNGIMTITAKDSTDFRITNFEGHLISNIFIGLIIGINILVYQSGKQSMELQLSRKELELNSLQQLKTKAQLETLQAKINPHFLYNSLNSIASLAHEDPNKVEQMAIALSKFFRYSTSSIATNYSTIEKEMEMVQTYLEIEKIRFGDRLHFTINLNATKDYLIPRFLIQPLAENAIKHGLSKITKQAVLNVNVQEKDNQIEINICDNGPGFPAELLMGYGLQSTYEKLNLLFPNQNEVQITNGDDKKITITIKKLIKDEPI